MFLNTASTPVGCCFVQIYHSTGALSAEGLFNNEGKKEGVWKRYYTDGKLKEESSYKNDLYEGKLVFFNDERDGEWVWYHVNGKLEKTGQYKFAKKIGTWKDYDENGKLEEEYSYLNGELEGVAKEYYNENIFKHLVRFNFI